MCRYYDRMAIVLVITLMVMKVSLMKAFAGLIPIFNYSYDPPVLCVLYVLIIGAIYYLVFWPKRRELLGLWENYSYIIAETVVLIMAVVVTDIVTLVNGQLRFTNILTHNLDYFYVLLAFPMIVLLVENKWKFCDFADTVMIVTMLSMVLRLFVVIYYGWTGNEIECIARESAFEGWIRNDRIRIVPPCFLMICGPLAVLGFNNTKSIVKKVSYVFMVLSTIFYAYYVWQSRMAILFLVCGVAVMLLFGKMPAKRLIIRWSVVVLGGIAFIVLGGVGKIIAMFSTSGAAKYIGENKGHYYAIDVFWGEFKLSPIFGNGLTETLAMKTNYEGVQWLADAGILYSLVPMGILIGLFFLMMFSRGIYVYFKGMRVSGLAVISLALTAVFLMLEMSMDCFFTPTAFVVPFLLTIVEYVNHKVDESYV